MIRMTTMISRRVKPRARIRGARDGLLFEIPVSDVGVLTFAAFLAVGSERIQIEILAMRSREDVNVRIAPGIVADSADVATLAPVAHRRIVGALDQGVEPEIGAGILEVIQLVH